MLAVIPGLSSPYFETHRAVYAILTEAAPRHGWKRVDVVVLPGQVNPEGRQDGRLSFQGAVDKLCTHVEAAGHQAPIRLVGISFGCAVALAAAERLTKASIEKVVLWGCIPLTDSWRAFRMGVNRERLASGTALIEEHEFFRGYPKTSLSRRSEQLR